MERIPVSGPSITQKEIDYVADATANAWYSQANMYNERFEAAFAAYVGTRFASALPSCTSAIHLALLALGIGPGDEVIIPDVTWIASAAPISYIGATPVFADIDPQTWCLASASFAECLTPRTKAVIPVDLYGNMPDMGALAEIAARAGVAIIEDAAEAIGSEYQGQKAGSFGSAGVFSFHGSKTLTTGEGGMLVTDSEALYQRVLFLRDHGRDPGGKLFFNTEIGYKYKMSSMQAALGLAQLERIEELIEHKLRIFGWYADRLGDLAGITLNNQASTTKNTYWMITAILDPGYAIKKDDLIQLMSAEGIDCRPFFRPLSSLPAYAPTEQAQLAQRRNSVSYQLSPYGINLPCGMHMTEDKVDYVCAALKRILQRGKGDV